MSRMNRLFLCWTLCAIPLLGNAANVIVGGREWRQLSETDSLSYAAFVNACGLSGTGVCDSQFAGWTWASNSDVQSLFDEIIQPGTTNFPTSISDYAASNDPDIAAAVRPPYFQSTYRAFDQFEFVRGITRDLAAPGMSYRPEIQSYDGPNLLATDHAFLSNTIASDTTNLFQRGGAWMYVTPVPLPGAVWLLGSGICALAALARRRRHPRDFALVLQPIAS